MKRTLLTGFLLLSIISIALYAQVPREINYQGKLTDPSGVAVDGITAITFDLFDVSTGGTPLWTEVHPTVDVSHGLFDVHLGSITALPTSIDFSEPYWIELTVEGEVLAPRQPLLSVPYSLRAAIADSVVGGSGSDGDWEWSSGSGITGDIYHTGRVAIGTTTPAAKLEVRSDAVGTVIVGAATGATGFNIGVYGESSSSGGVAAWFKNWGGGYGLIVETGNVGIGTATPENKLHVVSATDTAIYATGSLAIYGIMEPSTYGWIAGVRGGADSIGVFGQGKDYGTWGYTNFNNYGYLGDYVHKRGAYGRGDSIGVAGVGGLKGVSASGDIGLWAEGRDGGYAVFANPVDDPSMTDFAAIYGSANYIGFSPPSVTGIWAGYFDGDVAVAGDLNLDDVVDILDNDGDAPSSAGDVLAFDGTDYNWQAQSGGVGGSGVATRVAFWTALDQIGSDADLYWNNVDKNLGIGTTAPLSQLSVNGAGYSSSALYSGDAGYTYAARFDGTVIAEDGGLFQAHLISGYYALYGRIGSAVVTDKRAVYGLADGGNGTKYGGYFAATNTGVNYGLYASASGGTTNWAGYFDGDVAVAGDLNLDDVVDILDNDGDAPSSAGDVLAFDGTDYNWQAQSGGVTSDGTGNATRVAFWTTDNTTIGGDANLYWDNTNNNLGIGTAAPLSQLSVNGAGAANYGMFIEGPSTSTDHQAALYIHSNPFSSDPPDTYNKYYGIYVNQESATSAVYHPTAIYGNMSDVTAAYSTGVLGRAMGTGADGGRTYGVKGYAGGGSNYYNYAVYGELQGTRDGTAILGYDAIDHSGWLGTLPAGNWAGYFHGNLLTSDYTYFGDTDVYIRQDGSDNMIFRDPNANAGTELTLSDLYDPGDFIENRGYDDTLQINAGWRISMPPPPNEALGVTDTIAFISCTTSVWPSDNAVYNLVSVIDTVSDGAGTALYGRLDVDFTTFTGRATFLGASGHSFSSNGGVRGARGIISASKLETNYANYDVIGVGVTGKAIGESLTPDAISGTDRLIFAGVTGEIDGVINTPPTMADTFRCAGVWGVDNNAGTAKSYAGYFDGDVFATGKIEAGTITIRGESETNDAIIRYKNTNGGTWNYQEDRLLNYGRSPGLSAGYWDYAAYLWARSLIKFDVSEIPSSATITSANIVLYCSSANGTGTYSVYKLRRHWYEGDFYCTRSDTSTFGRCDSTQMTGGCCWEYYNTTSAWGSPGADNTTTDRYSTAEASLAISTTGWKTWDVTSAIQDIVDGTDENYGFIIIGPSSGMNNVSFRSSECAEFNLKPKLEVEWTY